MIKKFTFIFLIMLLLASCSSSNNSEIIHSEKKSKLALKEDIPLDFFPRNITVAAVGDSLTQGVGDSTERGGYVPYLEMSLEKDKSVQDAVFYNFGVRGNRSDQLLKKLGTEEVKDVVKSADAVIITIGGNDVMKVVRENFSNLKLRAFTKEKKNYEQNLIDVLDAIKEVNPNSKIVLIGLYNPFLKWFSEITEINEILEDWNGTSQAILKDYPGTYFVEIDDIFENTDDNLLYTDYFHPNDKGYELIAGRVHQILTEEVLKEIPYKRKAEGNGEKMIER
ncbi:lysophospholipase L1-like esterase [Cytobacillus firmus]|uniref:Lysophospholipase L1-like esterase n=2 Tax=Cytobacillus TaxID=2675230 RepID=A0A366JP64_CYTFI|nr:MULTISPECIES: SGNH/GDSL hydrolase family protein [Cytobacillus]RBP89120.1 lysophospholipase L1-like esterase [Cytobacillus firmus]TDX47027.1 lysophospholipase L1-like esterase [Cytobacillus oceanisediminis]